MHQRESHFRAIMETANDAIITVDAHGNIYDWNQGAEKIFGYQSQEIIGRPVRHLAPDTSETQARMTIFTPGKEQVEIPFGKSYEGSGLHKDGHIFNLELSLARWDSNGDSFTTAIIRDITERKAAENELITAKEKAEEMNRLKSNFLANMSHELRTPLIGVLGYSEILQSEAKDNETVKIAQAIQHSGDRLKNTLNMILDFSKIETVGIQVTCTPKNIVPFIKQIIGQFQNAAEQKKLALSYDFERPSIICNIEERLLSDVLSNLLKNAILYTEQGGVIVRTSVENTADTIWARIDVTDTGIGIAKKDHEVIFEECRQVSEGFNRSFEGTGLGLTLAKKYAELLSGTISVTSELGYGSTFTVRIPLVRPASVNETRKKATTESNETKAAEADLIPVLYVEDDDVSQIVTTKILRKICRVECGAAGLDALEMAAAKMSELVLVDINLGKGMDGIEVTKKLREIPAYKDTPIIAVTAYAMQGDREEFLAAGCTDYLSKPFRSNELLAIISKYIAGT